MQNAKGWPVLSKAVQALITRYTRLKTSPWIVLTDVGAIPTDEELDAADASKAEPALPTPAQAGKTTRKPQKPKDLTPYLSYLRHLQRTQPPRPIIDRFAAGYQDFLQSPLQPLTDNLESITYEVFEKDPIKYEWYERATAAALVDLKKTLKRDIIVAVVGAGRGPLMTRALKASASTGISIVPFAVEKNLNAHVLLQHRNATDPLWNKRVNIVKTDMRYWAGPTLPSGEVGKVDILISELLGSFADNELSPECLDGVQHVLHPDHGVSIPTSYTAHFTPIASPKIYSDLLGRTGAGADERWELPYVSMLHQFDNLCLAPSTGAAAATEPSQADIQQAWEFVHPIPQAILAQSQLRKGGSLAAGGGGAVGGDGWNEHNARFCKLSFTCTTRGVCHGLAGYFETVLYESKAQGKKIELSTNPVTMEAKSKDMISWFPIFFPLKV
jgi:protein arginine N-methyltransferase 5